MATVAQGPQGSRVNGPPFLQRQDGLPPPPERLGGPSSQPNMSPLPDDEEKPLSPAGPLFGITEESTIRAFLAISSVNWIHIVAVFFMYAFGLMRVQMGFFVVRDGIEKFVTNNHENMIMSAMPEVLIFPPWFLAFGLIYFYTFIVYQECAKESQLLAKQRRYTRYSLLTPVPHIAFIFFFTINSIVIYLACGKHLLKVDRSEVLILVITGGVLNGLWLISFAIYFPPFIRTRNRLVSTEKKLLQMAKSRLRHAHHHQARQKRRGSHKRKRRGANKQTAAII